MIPKIIHQTWKTEEIPEHWKGGVESCKELHADYKYILWTDAKMDAFVKREFPRLYDVYRAYPHPIQRCDAFRYMVLYKMGGIYLDLDTVCKKALAPFLKYDLVLAKSMMIESSFTNSCMMSVPRHPFLKACVDALVGSATAGQALGKHMHVMRSAGPVFLTERVKAMGGAGKLQGAHVLSKADFSGDCTPCKEECKGGVYFGHVKGKSWNGGDTAFFNAILCNKDAILVGLVGAAALWLGRGRRAENWSR